jgi:hypothetical protein
MNRNGSIWTGPIVQGGMVGRTWWAERLKQFYLNLFIINRCQTGSFGQYGMIGLSANFIIIIKH